VKNDGEDGEDSILSRGQASIGALGSGSAQVGSACHHETGTQTRRLGLHVKTDTRRASGGLTCLSLLFAAGPQSFVSERITRSFFIIKYNNHGLERRAISLIVENLSCNSSLCSRHKQGYLIPSKKPDILP
jgi:hypothetical protein